MELHSFEAQVIKKLDALLKGQADQMEWIARWMHESHLTGDARSVVARQLQKASDEVRSAISS